MAYRYEMYNKAVTIQEALSLGACKGYIFFDFKADYMEPKDTKLSAALRKKSKRAAFWKSIAKRNPSRTRLVVAIVARAQRGYTDWTSSDLVMHALFNDRHYAIMTGTGATAGAACLRTGDDTALAMSWE